MHSGEYLQDHLSLAYYDIRNVCNSLFPNNQVADIWQKSTIQCRTNDDPRLSFNIFLKTFLKNPIVIQVQSTDMIGDVKAKVQQQERISTDQQRLIFDGQRLEDGKKTPTNSKVSSTPS